MLLLKRNVGQSIHIGEHIVVTVNSVEGGRVTLDVVAPKEIPVLRDELIRRRQADHHPAHPKPEKEPVL
jgi:carbon storage regulator